MLPFIAVDEYALTIVSMNKLNFGSAPKFLFSIFLLFHMGLEIFIQDLSYLVQFLGLFLTFERFSYVAWPGRNVPKLPRFVTFRAQKLPINFLSNVFVFCLFSFVLFFIV